MRSETMAEPTALDRVPAGVRQRLVAEAGRQVGLLPGGLYDDGVYTTRATMRDSMARLLADQWLAELDALALQPLT